MAEVVLVSIRCERNGCYEWHRERPIGDGRRYDAAYVRWLIEGSYCDCGAGLLWVTEPIPDERPEGGSG